MQRGLAGLVEEREKKIRTVAGRRLVTLAKYAISLLRPVQGSVPPRPIPMLRVAATMSVSSGGSISGADSLDIGRLGAAHTNPAKWK